jgi:hypothetical protein
MLLPDFNEGLLLAKLVLEVDETEVLNLVRAERLHRAIMAPAAHVNGSPIHKTRAEIAKCLLVECATGRILPTSRQDFIFGWMMTQRAVELSHCKWRWPKGHQARMEKFRQVLAEGDDPGHELVVWLGQGIQPPFNPPDSEVTRPIYVSSPMHPSPEADMAAWADAVEEGLTHFLEDSESTETAFTHRPQIFPVVAASSAARQQKIEEQLHTADGLVVLGPQSSWGSAIELVSGLRVGIPTLFIHPSDAPPSERARAHLEAAEATILAIDGELKPEDALAAIEKLVYQWLEGSYSLVLGSQRRRACMETRYARFLGAIRAKRTQMTSLELQRELAVVGLPLDRARTLIEERWGLLSASTVELIALGNAFRVPANLDAIVDEPTPDRPPFLTPVEQSALDAFADERGLSVSQTIRLAAAGQREIVQPGRTARRRKLLTDHRQWDDLWKRELED